MFRVLFFKLNFLLCVIIVVTSCSSVKRSISNESKKSFDNQKAAIAKKEIASRDKIFKIINKFQASYLTKKSDMSSMIDEIFCDNTEAEVICGCAVRPHSEGWAVGKPEILKMFERHAKYWKKLSLNTDTINLTVNQNSSCMSTTGTLFFTDQFKKIFTQFTENITERIKTETMRNDALTSEIMNLLEDLIFNYQENGEPIFRVVLTAVFEKERGHWKIRQLHFSYPIQPELLDSVCRIEEI